MVLGSAMPAMPPPPDPSRIEVDASDSALSITLLPVPWRQAAARTCFFTFFAMFAACWTTIVIVFSREMWESSRVLTAMFLSVGALITLVGSIALWDTVRSTFFCVSVRQSFDRLEVRRLGSCRRWAANDVSAFDADQMALYCRTQHNWTSVSLPCRSLNDLRWLAFALAENWSIPSREPLGTGELLVTVGLIECDDENRTVFEAALRQGTLIPHGRESVFEGRLKAEPGRMYLRNEDLRSGWRRFRYVERQAQRRWKYVTLNGPEACIQRQDLIWFRRAGKHGIWIVCPPLYDSDLIAFELVPDDGSMLALALQTFCSSTAKVPTA